MQPTGQSQLCAWAQYTNPECVSHFKHHTLSSCKSVRKFGRSMWNSGRWQGKKSHSVQMLCYANQVLGGGQSHPNKIDHLKPSRPCQKAGWGSFLPFKERSRNTPACPNVALKNVIQSNEDWSFIEKHLGTRWKVADREEIHADYK